MFGYEEIRNRELAIVTNTWHCSIIWSGLDWSGTSLFGMTYLCDIYDEKAIRNKDHILTGELKQKMSKSVHYK